MSAYSDALYRVTYAWGLTFLPHVIKIVTLNTSGYDWDNRVGRYNMTKDAKAMNVEEAAHARARRADAAHQNSNESLAIFAPAIVAAVSAGVAPTEVDKFSKLYLVFRLLYVLIFVFNPGSKGLSLVRTGVWGGSVYCSITLLLRAARLLAAKGL